MSYQMSIQRIRVAAKHSIGVLALIGAWLLAAASAQAHEIRPAVVDLTLESDKLYTVEVNVNLEAMLADVSPQHSDTDESPNARRYDALRALPPAALRERLAAFVPELREALRIEFDGQPATPQFVTADIPPVGDLAVSRQSRLRFAGDVPAGARVIRWSYAERFGPNVLRLKRPQDREATAVWLKAGEASDVFPLQGDITPPSRVDIAWQYSVLGFTHILPKGLDHILFVLGLFLLSARLKPLLVQVTAFTLAHSITLGLTIYGVVSLSPAIVEPLIAASIVYVAVENLFTAKLHAWRPVVVFGFGLLHGMGFAGVLQEIGLPRSEFLPALITFNIGVEFGQLAVIAAAFLLVGMWRNETQWYRGRIVVPASLAIAATGLYWTVERVVG